MALSPPLLLINSTVAGSMKATRSQRMFPWVVWSRMARWPMPSCLRVVLDDARLDGSSEGVRGLVVM